MLFVKHLLVHIRIETAHTHTTRIFAIFQLWKHIIIHPKKKNTFFHDEQIPFTTEKKKKRRRRGSKICPYKCIIKTVFVRAYRRWPFHLVPCVCVNDWLCSYTVAFCVRLTRANTGKKVYEFGTLLHIKFEMWTFALHIFHSTDDSTGGKVFESHFRSIII